MVVFLLEVQSGMFVNMYVLCCDNKNVHYQNTAYCWPVDCQFASVKKYFGLGNFLKHAYMNMSVLVGIPQKLVSDQTRVIHKRYVHIF